MKKVYFLAAIILLCLFLSGCSLFSPLVQVYSNDKVTAYLNTDTIERIKNGNGREIYRLNMKTEIKDLSKFPGILQNAGPDVSYYITTSLYDADTLKKSIISQKFYDNNDKLLKVLEHDGRWIDSNGLEEQVSKVIEICRKKAK